MLLEPLLVCLALGWTGGVDPTALAVQESLTTEERFDALIRKTNDLRSFVAEYDLVAPGKEPQVLRIVYAAPDQALMSLSGRLHFRILDGTYYHWARGSPTQDASLDINVRVGADQRVVVNDSYAHFDLLGPSRRRWELLVEAIRTGLPKANLPPPARIGPCFQMQFSAAMDDKPPRANFGVTCDFGGALLGWLKTLRARTDGTTVDGDRMSFRDSGETEIVLSMKTGFIENADRKSKAGTATLRLRRLELDADIGRAAFDVLDPSPGWTDETPKVAPSLHRSLTRSMRHWSVRQFVKSVSDGTLEWNDAARGGVKEMFRVLYAGSLPLEQEHWIGGVRKTTDDFVDTLKAELAKRPPLDEEGREVLAEKISKEREGLELSLEKWLELYRSLIPADPGEGSAIRGMGELERTALAQAFGEVVSGPLLRHYDERTGELRQ